MEKGLTVQEDLRFRQSSLSILVFICNNIYRGGLLVWKIEGDFHSAVGFPAASFFKLLDLMVEKWFTGSSRCRRGLTKHLFGYLQLGLQPFSFRLQNFRI